MGTIGKIFSFCRRKFRACSLTKYEQLPIHHIRAYYLLYFINLQYYSAIKQRKNESRTYFLDRMLTKLNERIRQDEELERLRK